MKNIFKNKVILITGGTGSIGSAIVKELLKYNCKTIRVLGSDENGLHNLSLSLSSSYQEHFVDSMLRNKIRYFYGDITDLNRMISATENVDYVIHAAALKHVPICEYNPFEATKVNVIGTENMIKACFHHKSIEKFILISTDKVVNPTTVLGTTKLLAEKIVLNSNLNKGFRNIKLSVVRFGNVIGTRGSVLPKFILQLKENKDLTITDKVSTRFFVTVDGAVQSVMTSLQIMKGGEIFVPKTINAIKIYDLARALCKVYSNSHSKIKIVGLRQGEKIHEKIFTEDEIYKLKIYNNIYLIDHMNSHKLSKVKKMMSFFSSEQAKVLTIDQIVSYLKKFDLLDLKI
jgi:UDP-N-acetylglucosamine 4,6-dehydratase